MDKAGNGDSKAGSTPSSIPGVVREEKKNIFIVSALIIFAALGIGIFLVAGYRSIITINIGKFVSSILPTAAPLPSATPILTATPLPNPQLHPGEILYSSTFDTAESWYEGHTDDNFVTQDRKVEHGKYIWNATARYGFLDFSLPSTDITIPGDGYQISMDANMLEGSPDGAFGIVFDLVDDDNYWVWIIRGDGTSALGECVGGTYTDAPMAVNMVIPHENGETHTYTLKLLAETLYFYADGAQFGSFKTSTPGFVNFTNGKKFGIAIQLDQIGEEATFEFDNFVVSHPYLNSTIGYQGGKNG